MHARYDAYRDSEIKWLGKVPTHWKTMMIKNVYKFFGSGTTPDSSNLKYYENGTINWLNTTDLKNCLIYETKQKITPLALTEKSLKIYPINTLAIAMYGQGDTRGSVGLLKIETTTNQAACMMYRSSNSIPKYMFWWFVSQKTNIRGINVGATQPNMNQDFVRNLFISLPPLPEQKAIVEYLDLKTDQIDRKIGLLTQKATKYSSLKQSLINEIVTRGLDKTVTMKDSGVDWIGEVPEHWRKKRVKELFLESKRKSNTGEEILLSVSEYSGVTQKKDSITEDEFLTTARSLVGYKICKVGELVVNIMLAWKRGLGISPYYGIVSPSYVVYSTTKIACSKYFHYLFRSDRAIAEFKRNSKGIIDSRLRLYPDRFYALEVAIPEFKEQKAIADYLDIKTAHIDRIVESINNQINKLKELRKTIINDVVTGKINVM